MRISFMVLRVTCSLCMERYRYVTSLYSDEGEKEGVWPETSGPRDAEVVLDE